MRGMKAAKKMRLAPCWDVTFLTQIVPSCYFTVTKWARCLPMWGTMLAHVGHGACPKWAQPVSKMCPKRFKDETPEKGMKNDQSPYDTSMIL